MPDQREGSQVVCELPHLLRFESHVPVSSFGDDADQSFLSEYPNVVRDCGCGDVGLFYESSARYFSGGADYRQQPQPNRIGKNTRRIRNGLKDVIGAVSCQLFQLFWG